MTTATAADLATAYATIDRLCAEAQDRLPSFEAMLEAARAVLPGATLSYQEDRRGHAGDSLGQRAVEVHTDRYRVTLTVDWLDRRGHYGEVVEGLCAPRGFYDARLYVIDRAAEARYYASRSRGKSRRAFGVDLAELIFRGLTDGVATLREVVQQAQECGRLRDLRSVESVAAFEEAVRAYQAAAATARRAERTYYEQGTDAAHRARVETLHAAVRAGEVMVAAREAAGLPHPFA